MHGAWCLLLEWPGSLVDRISRDLAGSPARFSDGNGGATLTFLKLRNAGYIAQPLREIVGTLHESIDTAGAHGQELRRATMTSVEVAKYLRTGTREVVTLRRRGAFRTVGVARGSVLVPAFDRQEVEAIDRDMSRRLDLNRVNVRLGLPYYAVEQLCALGHIPLLKRPFFAARYVEPQTSRDAADRLEERLLFGRAGALDDARPLQVAMQMVGGRLKPWDAVVEAMLRGQLPYVVVEGREPLFRRIMVAKRDLLPFAFLPIARSGAAAPLMGTIDAGFDFDNRMTKRDAAEVLNLATRERTRLLAPYSTTPDPVVPVEAVLDLAARFVTNVEIAGRLGVPYQRVRLAAADIGIRRSSEAGYERSQEAAIVDAVLRRVP